MTNCKCENCECKVEKNNDRIVAIKAFLLVIGLGVFFAILWEILAPYFE